MRLTARTSQTDASPSARCHSVGDLPTTKSGWTIAVVSSRVSCARRSRARLGLGHLVRLKRRGPKTTPHQQFNAATPGLVVGPCRHHGHVWRQPRQRRQLLVPLTGHFSNRQLGQNLARLTVPAEPPDPAGVCQPSLCTCGCGVAVAPPRKFVNQKHYSAWLSQIRYFGRNIRPRLR